MRLSIALTLATVLLSTVVGCARSAKPVTPDASGDWTPPGEMDVRINDSARATNVAKQSEQTEAYRPNKSEIPKGNAVHPAVY